jgi:hypothetical protein
LNFLRKRLFPLVSQIGINYRESSLSVNDGNFKVKAGDRMPYFEVEGSSIYDRLREPTFHLLLFSDGSTPVNAAFNDLLELVDVHSFPLYPNVAEIFGMDESFTILLRPDNYIGLISEVISPDVVQNYLAQTMGR